MRRFEGANKAPPEIGLLFLREDWSAGPLDKTRGARSRLVVGNRRVVHSS